MSSDINLIKQTSTQRKAVDKLMAGLYAFFAITFLAAAGILAYSFTFQTRLDSLTDEKTALTNTINGYQEQKDSILIISERLGGIQTILSQRKNIDQKLEEVLSIVPSNILVESVKVDEEMVSMRLSSPRLSDFDSLLESGIPTFTASAGNEVKLIEVGSFSQLASGYTVSLDFYYTVSNRR